MDWHTGNPQLGAHVKRATEQPDSPFVADCESTYPTYTLRLSFIPPRAFDDRTSLTLLPSHC
jgi:hypothetical protein